MGENKYEVSLRIAIMIIAGVIVVVIAIGMFIGNNFIWAPADDRNIADKRFDSIEMAYKRNPNAKSTALAYAIALGERGDKKNATKVFDVVYDKYPKDNMVLLNYAIFQIGIGKNEEAKKMLERIVEESPYFVPANIRLGVILGDEGEFDEAIEKFDNALKLEPGSADILLEKAKVYISMDDKEKARNVLQKALSFVPDYTEAQKLLNELE